jgi:oxygen-independent coproporphyrinogen-3 oxidase
MSSRNPDPEEPTDMEQKAPVSIYVHIPFCERSCLYFDFVTEAGKSHLIPNYLVALAREVEEVAQGFPTSTSIHTIYLGGGTPSLLPATVIKAVLENIRRFFPVRDDAEVTLEMNPGTIKPAYLENLKQIGVNRLSIGLQSAIDQELQTLGRIHSFSQFQDTFNAAKEVGFDNISADLIYGIPGQSLPSWERSLKKLLDLQPSHASLYSLTIEKDTPFAKMVEEGRLIEPENDLLADMYERASEIFNKTGFVQYEISNWAGHKPDGSINSSWHNLQYWRNLPYLGIGTGAHGCMNGIRTANTTSLEEYIRRSKTLSKNIFPRSFATAEWHSIGEYEQMQDFMMLGLRLTEEGVSACEFFARFGIELREIFGKEIDLLVNQGLLEELGDDRNTIRLTRRGRLLGNQVFMNFVGD